MPVSCQMKEEQKDIGKNYNIVCKKYIMQSVSF